MSQKKLKADIDLLCRVMRNQSPTHDIERQMNFAEWIVDTLVNTGLPFVYDYDDYGNLYVTKGKVDLYPCIVAHLDTVHQVVNNYVIKRVGNFIIGFDNGCGEQVGCGADDRVGISIAIEMFKQHSNIKLFFPLDEECGGFGSNNCNIKFFENCCFMIQPDRNMYKNKRDYINHTNGVQVTTNEFDKAVRPFMKDYGYTTGRGTFTDIGELVLNGANICCFNLSCYLNAHTDQETVWIPLYKDALNFVNDVIINLSYRQWLLPKVERMNYSKYGFEWKNIPYENLEPVGSEPDYFNVAMDEAYSCTKNCCGDYTEIQLDNSIFCTKCQKTLGEAVLINTVKGKDENAWESGWGGYYD